MIKEPKIHKNFEFEKLYRNRYSSQLSYFFTSKEDKIYGIRFDTDVSPWSTPTWTFGTWTGCYSDPLVSDDVIDIDEHTLDLIRKTAIQDIWDIDPKYL